jgi:hypothetical protein
MTCKELYLRICDRNPDDVVHGRILAHDGFPNDENCNYWGEIIEVRIKPNPKEAHHAKNQSPIQA